MADYVSYKTVKRTKNKLNEITQSKNHEIIMVLLDN